MSGEVLPGSVRPFALASLQDFDACDGEGPRFFVSRNDHRSVLEGEHQIAERVASRTWFPRLEVTVTSKGSRHGRGLGVVQGAG